MNRHNRIQVTLEQRLIALSQFADDDWYVNTEEHIECPVVTGFRRIDVVVETNDQNQTGYAFEIKTDSSSRHHVSPQIRDYLINGYRPILVAPESILDGQLPTSRNISIRWIIDFLNASSILFDETDPVEFEIIKNRLPRSDNFRSLLKKL